MCTDVDQTWELEAKGVGRSCHSEDLKWRRIREFTSLADALVVAERLGTLNGTYDHSVVAYMWRIVHRSTGAIVKEGRVFKLISIP